LITVLSVDRPVAQESERKPTLIPPENKTPAPTPSDPREVAILTLIVKSGPDGQLDSIVLKEGLIINSYAPNVLERTGPWTVELVGDEALRYGILDPRWQEAFPGSEGDEFESEIKDEVVWDLVAPLYLFDRDLRIQTILIYDQSGARVFAADVDRQNWRR
jgi:hypothetical protein